jgi:hypothetical protein
MSPLFRSARPLRACIALLALAVPATGAAQAVTASPAVLRPVPSCGDGATQAHHRPLPAPGPIAGGPVRRGPAYPCL